MSSASAYERGREVELDLQRARELYQRACEHADQRYESLYGGDSCFQLARLDPARAVEWLERGCATTHADSCNNLGVHHAKTDVAKARTLYAEACDRSLRIACRNLGLSWRDHAPQDPARSIAPFTRGCQLQDGFACGALGYAIEATDPATAAKHYQTACDHDVGSACHNLALLHREGRGVVRSDELADELVRRACKAGESDACR